MIVSIIQNNAIEQMGELSWLFPNVSFPPSGPEAEWMDENNLVPVTYWKAHDAATEKLVNVEPYIEGGNVFAVEVQPLAEEEIASRNESRWAKVRADRNQRLAGCDWTQLQDAPVDSTVWATYRQDLRDITNQSDPFNIQWPEQPA